MSIYTGHRGHKSNWQTWLKFRYSLRLFRDILMKYFAVFTETWSRKGTFAKYKSKRLIFRHYLEFHCKFSYSLLNITVTYITIIRCITQ